jgi:hypothetical protein
MPAGFSKEATRARRKEFRKPKRAAAERRRGAKKHAADEAGRARVSDLDCRSSAILATLTEDQWLSASDIAKLVSASPAFSIPGRKPPTGDSLRRTVARELEKPALAREVEQRIIRRRNVDVAQFRRRPRAL